MLDVRFTLVHRSIEVRVQLVIVRVTFRPSDSEIFAYRRKLHAPFTWHYRAFC